jgi:heat shock protein HtpX
MAMDFWEAKRKARGRTTFYLIMFMLLTLAVAIGGELVIHSFLEEGYETQIPLFGITFLGITLAVAAYNYSMYKAYGGDYVAVSVGARPADPDSFDPKEGQLLNIVEEVSLAASLPMPGVYIIPSQEINAFAAGLSPDKSVIAITQGALVKLNRDEIQGVIAHEFGHIANADMVINLRLAAMVMGFYVIIFLGLRLMQATRLRSRDSNNGKGGNPIILFAVALLAAGAITWFIGKILQAMVSRQREYLADASSVQYTRNPTGIANALRKIAKDGASDMPSTGSAFSHMYFEEHSSLFSTHPPLKKRIAAIEGRGYDENEEI